MKKRLYVPFLALFFGLTYADTDVTYFNFIQNSNITSISYTPNSSCYDNGKIVNANDIKSGYYQPHSSNETPDKFFVKAKLDLNNSSTCGSNFANEFPDSNAPSFNIFPNFKSAEAYKELVKKPHPDYSFYPKTFYFSINGTFTINTSDGNSYNIPLTLVEGRTNVKGSEDTNLMWIASADGQFAYGEDYYQYYYNQGLTVQVGNNQSFCFMPGDDTQTIRIENGNCGVVSYNYGHS